MISSKVKYSPLLLQVGTGVPKIQVFSDMIFVVIRAHAQCGLLDHDPQYPLDTNIHVCYKNNGVGKGVCGVGMIPVSMKIQIFTTSLLL